jgi:hypothetical protein
MNYSKAFYHDNTEVTDASREFIQDEWIFTSLSDVQFILNYDAARLTYLRKSAGSFFDACPVVNDDGDKVSIACAAYGIDGVDGSGDIISIDFLAESPGPAVLELVDITAADANNQGTALVTEPLTVTVI